MAIAASSVIKMKSNKNDGDDDDGSGGAMANQSHAENMRARQVTTKVCGNEQQQLET